MASNGWFFLQLYFNRVCLRIWPFLINLANLYRRLQSNNLFIQSWFFLDLYDWLDNTIFRFQIWLKVQLVAKLLQKLRFRWNQRCKRAGTRIFTSWRWPRRFHGRWVVVGNERVARHLSFHVLDLSFYFNHHFAFPSRRLKMTQHLSSIALTLRTTFENHVLIEVGEFVSLRWYGPAVCELLVDPFKYEILMLSLPGHLLERYLSPLVKNDLS